MDAIQILAKATAKATFLILEYRGIDPKTVDLGILSTALRETLSANLDKIMGEWKDATECHFPNEFLRTLMNAQANEMGLKAVEAMGY